MMVRKSGLSIGLGMAVTALGMGGCGGESGGSGIHDSEGVISLAEFTEIQTGMSYEAVIEIIGGEGVEVSRTEVAGIPTTVMYAWDGTGVGGNANIMFQDGKVMSKSQAALK